MSLPPWTIPLLDPVAARAVDRWAIEERGIPGLDLMERAAEALAAAVLEAAPQGRIAVVCGAGNNAGDGYAAARLLRKAWRDVDVFWARDPHELTGDAAVQAQRLPGAAPAPFTVGCLAGCTLVVDALLGIGTAGAPRGAVADAITAISASGLPVVACDVPSGVDAATGEVAAPAIRALATVTFDAPKIGLLVHPGKAHAGSLRVADIGIPRGAPSGDPRVGLIEDDPLLRLLSTRGPQWTKFTSGRVLIAGGSQGLLGAVVLAAQAAMRAGAGYVTACVPAGLEGAAAAQLVEVMQIALPAQEGGHSRGGVAQVLESLAQRRGTLVLGPGLGRHSGAAVFARELAAKAPGPLVLDADGLGSFARELERLIERDAPTVLTPHEGELARLLGVDSADVAGRRLHHARLAAERSGAIVVLKGDDTLIADPGGAVMVSPGASPALATAGTGDVLSGVIGALLARGEDPLVAACAGVRLHARAGGLAAQRLGVDGAIARDIIAELPAARP
ncbi:unannotated protein [freshwater metagenome]|uniref:Nicotinamide nucleotide repair protein n=1 Tax=freshwater metagenome TaxID=449393 RepID=A0A6J7IKY4_9ZZZZ|nr:NAD(P)H-hydrate dehydratase [Actinomycetota bacterium]